MRGTGPVALGPDVVYAYFTVAGRAARVRVSADDCDRHDLFPGRQLQLGIGGRAPEAALVTGVGAAPPFAWVEFEIAGRAEVD